MINNIKKFIEFVIYNSRWVLVVFYFGLIIAQCLYCYKFGHTLIELCHNFPSMDETKLMLGVLALVDITMIANLLKMIISGSYQSFVNKIGEDNLEKISSGYLKVKIGTSLIGVSSIHLLQAFINAENVPTHDLISKSAIHIIFLVSTIGLAYIDYLHVKNKATLGPAGDQEHDH